MNASTSVVKLVTHEPGNKTSSGDDESDPRSVSPNGRFVAFESNASNLIDSFDDNNTTDFDIFLADRKTGRIILVSHTPGNPSTGAAGASRDPVVSADGRFVAFDSTANDLLSTFTDGNGTSEDVYLFDRTTGIVTLVSHKPGASTTSANDFANDPIISGNGNVIAFESDATDLVPHTDNNSGGDNVYVYKRGTDAVSLVSHAAGDPTAGADGSAFPTQLSQGGRYIGVESGATNLVENFQTHNGGQQNAYLADLKTDTIVLASHASTGPSDGMDGTIGHVSMSPDGSTVGFSSSGTNLVAGYQDNNAGKDVYTFTRSSGKVRLVSHIPGSTIAGTDGTGGDYIELSNGGNYVVFESAGTTLVSNFDDVNGSSNADVYLFSKRTGNVRLVSHQFDSRSAGGDFASYLPGISADGRVVVFISYANNLISNFDDNDGSNPDAFTYTRKHGHVALASHTPGHPKSTGDIATDVVIISADGHTVYFASPADDLVDGFIANSNGPRDIFLLKQ